MDNKQQFSDAPTVGIGKKCLKDLSQNDTAKRKSTYFAAKYAVPSKLGTPRQGQGTFLEVGIPF